MSITLCGFLCEPVKLSHSSAHKWPQLNRNKPLSHCSFQLLWKVIMVAQTSPAAFHFSLPTLTHSRSQICLVHLSPPPLNPHSCTHFFHCTTNAQNHVSSIRCSGHFWSVKYFCDFRQVKVGKMKRKLWKKERALSSCGNYSTAPWWWERSFVPRPPRHLSTCRKVSFIHSQKSHSARKNRLLCTCQKTSPCSRSGCMSCGVLMLQGLSTPCHAIPFTCTRLQWNRLFHKSINWVTTWF